MLVDLDELGRRRGGCPTPVPHDSVVIVEGMFLHRDELRSWWDVSVFLDVPFPVSLRRMAQRDGTDPDPDSPGNRQYVEGQRLYLASCAPTRCASFVIDNS
jgi:uridine kinase